MKKLVAEILKYHRLTEEFHRNKNFKLRVSPPRPNELEIRKREGHVFIGEATGPDYWYIRQDMTYSPEMEFEVTEGGVWCPIYLKEPHKPGRRSVVYEDGCRQVREVRLRNQVRFATSWSEVLRARDYHRSILRSQWHD